MAENEFEVSGEREFDWSPALRTVSAEGYDPYSQFSKFATGFRPSERQALNKLYEPLSARYALGGVGVPAFQGYGLGGQAIDPRQHEDFRSYLTGYDPSGSNRMSFNTMLSRAQRARDIAKLSSKGFEDLYGGLESSADKTSASWARYMYETSPDAAQNQMKLAQLLALQRPDAAGGQGEYGGIMRSAISSAMDEIYNARIAQDKSPNSFLDWYLSKTGRRGDQALPAVVGLGGENLGDPSFGVGSTSIPTNLTPDVTDFGDEQSFLLRNQSTPNLAREEMISDLLPRLNNVSPYSGATFGANLEDPLLLEKLSNIPSRADYSGATFGANLEDPLLTAQQSNIPTAYEDPLLRDQLANIPNAGLDYGLSNVMPNTVIPNTYQHVPYTGMNFQDWQLNDTIQNLVIPNMSTETPMERIRRLQKEEDLYRMGGGM